MTNKNLGILVGAALVLGGAAYCLSGNAKPGAPKLNGRQILPSFEVADVARIEVGGKLALAAGEKGWTVESYHGYPADRAKIVENLLKLQELRVGQLARGRKLGAETKVLLKDAKGGEIVSLTLGDRHQKWGHGRYVGFDGETVLVKDPLDAFDGDPKKWCETKIVDQPWISFSDLADATLADAETGFSTGIVAKVTIAGDTNRTVTVGAPVKGGSDRYLKLDDGKWIFKVPSYSVESLLPKPPPEKKEEPAKPASQT